MIKCDLAHLEVLRRAFRILVVEENISEAEWPTHAVAMFRSLTGQYVVDTAIVAWIIAK